MFSPTLCSYLDYWSRRWPERLAVKTIDATLSWGELAASSRAIAAALIEAGVQKGDRIGILMNNRIEFVEAIFGILQAGGIVTLLNIRNTAAELLYTLEDAGIGVVFSEPCFHPLLEACMARGATPAIITTDAGSRFQPLQHLREHVDRGEVARRVDTLQRDDIGFICYTSGTTGQPKGAMFSHGNLLESATARCLATGITFEDRSLLPLPMAYTGGLCNYLRDAFIPGGTAYIEAGVDAERMLKVIEEEGITVLTAVPVVWERMLALSRERGRPFPPLRHATTGGAAISVHLIREYAELGIGLTQGYGLTESCGSYVALLAAEDAERKMGFAGKPVLNARVRVVDEEGNDQPAGVAGEILISGPMLMKGYYNRPEETARTIVDGWLHTGDIGLFDEEGYLKIVDRKKDMLISGGLNVYPAELERALAGVPGLAEFVVVGVPDPKWGEVPMIVAHDSESVDMEALRQRCLEQLSDYKRPRWFCAWGEPLPRTYSGKILKREIQQRLPQVPPHAIELQLKGRGVG